MREGGRDGEAEGRRGMEGDGGREGRREGETEGGRGRREGETEGWAGGKGSGMKCVHNTNREPERSRGSS